MKRTLAWLLTLFMVMTVLSMTVFATDSTDVAKIGETGYATLTEAISALADGDTLTIFEGTYDAALTITKSNVTVIGQGEVVLNGVPTLRGTNYKVENIDFNYTNGYNNLSGSGLIKDCTFTATENTFRYCYGAKDGVITFEGTTFNPANGYWAIHFDEASGTDLTFTDCVINGKVALASDLGSLTANNTEFNNAYVNVWGTEDGASFEDCEFNEVPYIFTGYDADNTVDFSDCTVVENGNSASISDIIYGGVDNADAKITNDGVLIAGGVAKIGQTQYETLAKALAAAVDGDTVTLLWAEGDAPISMAGSVFGNKTITITGTATVDWNQGWLFVGRGGEGNGTLIFDNATITSASNSSSTGIHVSGRAKDTNNKYDGTLVIKNSSIELDYLINRNAIEVDNSTLTVKNGFGIAGRPASETESGAAATATIDIKNGSYVKVLNHNGMGVGVASSVDEGYGVLNLTDSTFECASFNINGTKLDSVTLGDFNVYGESVLEIATLTGREIDLHHNAIIKDSTVGGEVMLYGKVTFRGENTFAMLYDYGNAYSTEYAEWIVEKGASVTLTDKARYGLGYGDKLTIYGSIADALTARENLTEEDISVFMHGLVAMSTWNVEHSMTVKDAYVVIGSNNSFGNTPKSGYSGTYTFTFDNVVLDSSRITFYAAGSKTEFTFNKSDVNVGAFMIRDADSVFTLTDTKLVATTTFNGNDEGNYLAGTLVLNNSSLSYAAPLVMENGSLTVGAGSTLTAPSITGAGTIVIDTTGLTDEDTPIVGNLSGFTGTIEVVGDTNVLASIDTDGNLVLTTPAASIGDSLYYSLQAAIDAVEEGQTIVLLKNVTVTTPAYGQNALNYAKAVSCTIDLNGKTLTADTGNSVFRFNISGSGATSDVTVTMKNGKVVSGSNTWCAVMASGISEDIKAIFNLENLVIENSKGYDFAVKAWGNSVVNANNVTINATKQAGGFYAVGGEMVLDNCTVNQQGLYTAPYTSMAFAVASNGKMTINSGDYSTTPTAAEEGNGQGSTHGSWVGGVMNSGGTLIINGGTFANGNYGDDSLATAARGLLVVDTGATLEVNGGTFNALKGIIDYCNNLGDAAKNPVVTLKGGTYSADPQHKSYDFIAKDYRVYENSDGTFTVAPIPYVAQIGDVKYETLEEAIANTKAGDTINILRDVEITQTLDVSYNSDFEKINVTINGNGHTIKAVASDYWTNTPKAWLVDIAWNVTLNDIVFDGNNLGMRGLQFYTSESTLNNVIIKNISNDSWGITDYAIHSNASELTVTGTLTFENCKHGHMVAAIGSNLPAETVSTVTVADNAALTGVSIILEGDNTTVVTNNPGAAVAGAVTKLNGVYYATLEDAFDAAASGDTIVLIADVNAPVTYAVNKTLTLDLNGKKIASGADVALTATAGKLTIVDSSEAKTGEIIGTQKALHSSAYVAIKSGKFAGAITTANGQTNDSQVCITGGTFTVEPDADLVEHCYQVEANGDGTYKVVDILYTVILDNGGTNAVGAGEYICGQTVYLYAGTKMGCQFAGWMSSDIEIANAGSTTISFVMPDHAVTVTAYWASSGTGSTVPVAPMTGTLSFETNGGTAVAPITRVYGTKVDLTQYVTTREGYVFAGWYADAALTAPVAEITVIGSKTVYAGWIEIPVIPDIPVVTLPFTDVAKDAYYYDAVLWAVSAGITNGTSDTTFSPDTTCTRAQVVTFLWRAAGCPVAQNNDMPFTDVSRDMYYYDAVLWAVEQGITNGVSATEFAPDAECTRGQIVTFLWRSQGSPAAAADGGFHDVEADAYYATAVEWAVDNGITNGIGDNAFGADAECTRGQTVTFLYRHFCR